MDEEEGLECPVCMEVYDEGIRTPKMMSCLHTICITCVVGLVPGGPQAGCQSQVNGSKEPSLPRGVTILCPLCRENISTGRIQTNRYVLAHLRDLQRFQDQNISSSASGQIRAPIPFESKPPITYQPPSETFPLGTNVGANYIPQPSFYILPQDPNQRTGLFGRSLSERDIPGQTIGRGILGRRHVRSAPPPPPFLAPPPLAPLPPAPPPPPFGRRHRRRERRSAPNPLYPPANLVPNPQQPQYAYYPQAPPVRTEAPPRPSRSPTSDRARTVTLPMPVPFSSGASSSLGAQAPPKTPVAGHPMIYPKLPPATTFHQRRSSHEESKAVMKIIGSDTPVIPEDDPDLIASPSAPEVASAPPAAGDFEDIGMWCRTCEEPGRDSCKGHDLIPLLRDEEINWIQTNQQVAQIRSLSVSMQRASLGSSTGTGMTASPNLQGKVQIKVLDMSKLSYHQLRDTTMNTNVNPEVLMACQNELDRRRLEHRRTVRRKAVKKYFVRSAIMSSIF